MDNKQLTDVSSAQPTVVSKRTYAEWIRRVTVPHINIPDGRVVYHPIMLWFAVLAGLLGGLILGVLGWDEAVGAVTIARLSPIAAAGPGPAAFALGGIGAALGAFIGGVAALYSFPQVRR